MPTPDPGYRTWCAQQLAPSDRLDAALQQLTLIGPRAGAELRRLVYGTPAC